MVRLMKIWMRRILTPLGRIAVLKSLILSKLVYLWMLLPNPPDGFITKLQKTIFTFVWNNKPDKVSRKTSILNVTNGGLGIPDVRNFITALKLTWIRKLKNGKHKWVKIITNVMPILADLENFGGDLPVSHSVNDFWHDVLDALKLFSLKIDITTTDELLAEPIFYNSRILVGRRSFFIKTGMLKVFVVYRTFLIRRADSYCLMNLFGFTE
ncbi:hypothetical protein BaRGS_00024011 [Batillaria attramentaria]|uniref:RNA-directed DNA polymerase, eukaryota, reverse transcriptase zinc-binding domain protein n=1 Tax=Batillaria attramentaria TaxID=370345 RepID=A0ABD0KCB9_9CAEN